jgi:hypothetical protein
VVGKDNLDVVEGTAVENASVDDIKDTIDKNVDATAIIFLFLVLFCYYYKEADVCDILW